MKGVCIFQHSDYDLAQSSAILCSFSKSRHIAKHQLYPASVGADAAGHMGRGAS